MAMKGFSGGKIGRVLALRLDPGEDVLPSLQRFIDDEGVRDGAIVSAIGTLKSCVLHMVMTTTYPAVEHFERWEDKPLELSSIDGIIADGHMHLHTVVSDHEKAYSGHLEEGSIVLYLAEIVIIEFLDMPMKRVKNSVGINELQDRA